MSQPAHSPLLQVEFVGAIAQVGINRPEKRNALNDDLVKAIKNCFESMPETVKAIVLYGIGEHFCAGLDLSEVSAHTVPESVQH